ncbi:MAG: Alpha-amylase precursor [Syntrophorhabdus sp. PtaB.Bin006]|nr:MAG: Alpha-amylase precursor [Syntrophorhabdus sp. PtaB.Bin006]
MKVDAVWLMGVWERSPQGIAIANQNNGLLEDFRRALSDYRTEDNVGSPYCVRQYTVDEHLGGPQGLAVARGELARREIKLILDFVPNHVAPDHPWVDEHPEYFIQGDRGDLDREPASFVEKEGRVFACGRDPYFPPWPDVLQLNAFQSGLRQTVIETLSDIADQCDGIRCDMAMLMLNNIFEGTWGDHAGQRPATEYWADVISAIKKVYPDFLFMAEAYWDLEWELQQQGFDYCYDKRLYDRLEHDSAESVRLHLCADLGYQEKLVRFIENHDEPRACSAFSLSKGCAAAVIMTTVPGAKLFHEGQFEGRKVRLPVFLGRRPAEPIDPDLQSFYRTLLRAASSEGLRSGCWQLCDRTGWPDNQSCLNIISWCWAREEERCVIIVNYSGESAQARIHVPWDELRGKAWRLSDALSGDTYDRSGDEMRDSGLYVDLAPWGCHFLCFNPLDYR